MICYREQYMKCHKSSCRDNTTIRGVNQSHEQTTTELRFVYVQEYINVSAAG